MRIVIAFMAGLVWILALATASIYLVGCTMTRPDGTVVSFMQLAPGEDVQSRTSTLVGIEAAPLGLDGPQFRLGYIRSQQARVPSYDEESTTPYVKIDTKVDRSGVVTETFEVNDEPRKKGFFE